MSSRKRIALIGCGRIAEEHIREFLAAGCEIAAIAARSHDEVDSVYNSYRLNARVYLDHQVMLRETAVDIVSIITPDFLHAVHVRDVLQLSSADILCEKPLTLDAEEGYELHRVAEKKGIIHGVRFPLRSKQPFTTVKSLVEDGLTGRIHHISIRFSVSRLSDPELPFEWRMSREQGGYGVLSDLGSHGIDFLRNLLGSSLAISEVKGFWKILHRTRRNQDGSECTVDAPEFVSGVMQVSRGITVSAILSRVSPGEQFLQIDGEKGSLRIDNGKLYVRELSATTHQRPESTFKEWNSFSTEPLGLIQDFVQCSRERKLFTPGFHDGAQAVSLIDRIFSDLKEV